MKKYSIYVHIPFCVSKCIYCDFNSFANKDNLIHEYIQAVVKQIDNNNSFSKQDVCQTIYIGGGTPSHIDSKYIEQILRHIYQRYSVDKNVEITIEQNPCSMTKNKLEHYYQLGINRLSIGLQTTNNDLLKIIGRKHSYEEFVQKYDLARSVGFNNINVDLMLGLPNEKIVDVENDVKKIIDLQPQHISCYSLIVYENTPMYTLLNNNRYILPDAEIEREMYYCVGKMLKDSGYSQYEISNFSQFNMQSKHNLMCWNQYEYIGFGAGAHSFVNNVRYQNIDSIEKYIENNEIIIHEEMTMIERMKEFMILGLRLISGLDANRFKKIYNQDMFVVFNNELDFLQKNEYIRIKDNQIYLTQRGIDYNNTVCEVFI